MNCCVSFIEITCVFYWFTNIPSHRVDCFSVRAISRWRYAPLKKLQCQPLEGIWVSESIVAKLKFDLQTEIVIRKAFRNFSSFKMVLLRIKPVELSRSLEVKTTSAVHFTCITLATQQSPNFDPKT